MILRMFQKLADVGRNDQGQDLAEYCLITALIALISCGLFYQASDGIAGLWTTANSTLNGTDGGGTTTSSN